MSREDILTEVYNSQIVNKMSSKFKKQLGDNLDDYVGMLLQIICEIPEEKLIRLYASKQLYFYIVSICRNQVVNNNSDFNKLMCTSISFEDWDDWKLDDDAEEDLY